MGEDLPSNGQERFTSVVVAGLAVTFPLADVVQGWHLSAVAGPVLHSTWSGRALAVSASMPALLLCIFPRGEHLVLALQESCLIAFLTSSSVRGLLKSLLVFTRVSLAMALSLISTGRFSTWLKWSAHLSRICFFSVSSCVPSAVRRGEEPED